MPGHLQTVKFISIHAPLVGSDWVSQSATSGTSSRSPCGERPLTVDDAIEALQFQSTLPLWGATLQLIHAKRQMIEFQSTLPLWGATVVVDSVALAVPISIHAPLVGSDAFDFAAKLVAGEFQSTLPLWGATGVGSRVVVGHIISIHAPLVGSDLEATVRSQQREIISIHAPLVGSDYQQTASRISASDFNPRSPCGERQEALAI